MKREAKEKETIFEKHISDQHVIQNMQVTLKSEFKN